MTPITTDKKIQTTINKLIEMSKACDDGAKILDARLTQIADQETSLKAGNLQYQIDNLSIAIELLDKAVQALQGKYIVEDDRDE